MMIAYLATTYKKRADLKREMSSYPSSVLYILLPCDAKYRVETLCIEHAGLSTIPLERYWVDLCMSPDRWCTFFSMRGQSPRLPPRIRIKFVANCLHGHGEEAPTSRTVQEMCKAVCRSLCQTWWRSNHSEKMRKSRSCKGLCIAWWNQSRKG